MPLPTDDLVLRISEAMDHLDQANTIFNYVFFALSGFGRLLSAKVFDLFVIQLPPRRTSRDPRTRECVTSILPRGVIYILRLHVKVVKGALRKMMGKAGSFNVLPRHRVPV